MLYGLLLGLLFVFEGVLIEQGVDDHGPSEVVVFLSAECGERFLEELEALF